LQDSLLIVTWDEGYIKAFGPGFPNTVPAYVLACGARSGPASSPGGITTTTAWPRQWNGARAHTD
jgi:hypothetical protein